MSVLLTTKKIIKEWTDYNNHMNLSYYILVFDMGAEVILSKFETGHQPESVPSHVESTVYMA